MSSKFLNKAFGFLQRLPGFDQQKLPFVADQNKSPGARDAPQLEPLLPRWVVTTRPWAQSETEQTICDYESAQAF